MMDPGSIEAIVRQSQSNLAVTLICLPKSARQDMRLFYAFCRIVDDIADEAGRTVEDRRAELARWEQVVAGSAESLQPLEWAVQDLMARRGIPQVEMSGILQGVSADLTSKGFATWNELQAYCHGVASCVGLVSIRIFGCTQAASREYAVQLGYALQLTNILRDVGQDLREHDRIYLPQEDLERFGVAESDLRAQRLTPAFQAMMEFETQRAREFYAAARASLTPADKPKLRAAETMRRIYTRVLELMEADGYQVFTKRYRVSTPGKLSYLARAVIGSWFGR